MPIPEFLDLDEQVIIATKGLPCTAKLETGNIIGWWWTKCPVLHIGQFLDTLSLEKDYTFESSPSPDEAERLNRLAFEALCKVASNKLQLGYRCVVVKSRLCSTFEVDRLVQLGKERGCGMILIIEFRMHNEYRYQVRLEHKVESGGQKEWYKPRSWKDDIEKAIDDYEADNWDLHLHDLLSNGEGLPPVTRLVLDPFDDLFLSPKKNLAVNTVALDIINHLLGTSERVQGRELVVQFWEVGRTLREKDLSRPRSTGHVYLCYICVFKYWEELEADIDDEGNPYCCGVCENLVISGQPAYACQNCALTLHKSCAEVTVNVDNIASSLPEGGHSCKSCFEQGQGFTDGCVGCAFQTHLKSRVLPTILKHDCHHHFLSMNFHQPYKCRACGIDHDEFGGSYICYICFMHYRIGCVLQPTELEHEHGGHQHRLKVMYSRDGVDKEEAYWCEICYEDIDPQNWFFSCQDCPFFEAHPNCV